MTTGPSATDLVAVENKVPEIISEITSCIEEGKKLGEGDGEYLCHTVADVSLVGWSFWNCHGLPL